MTDYPLSLRTREQLLEDFDGRTPPQEKMLNFIHSVYDAIDNGGGGAVAWEDITGKPETFPPTIGVTPRVVTGSASVNNANHLGQLLIVNSAGAATMTIATDIPDNSTGVILSIGAGAVSIAAQSGDVDVASGKVATIAGQYMVAQWVKYNGNIVLFGALADA